VSRRYFGTDGVRGVVGDTLTVDLVERLGGAVARRTSAGSLFIGRDTRGSGPELEAAFVRGVVAAGGTAVRGGVLPTPAIALQTLDAAVVITASHNPPEYNGVKFFGSRGQKLTDAQEEEIEALLDGPPAVTPGRVEEAPSAVESYLDHVLGHFGTDLTGLRIGVDCANGAYSGIAPEAFARLGAEVVAVANEPDGTNINVESGATDLRLLSRTVREHGLDLGFAFDGDGDRMLAVDAHGETVDGDQIVAILALSLGVGSVAVTVMTNLGFHRLMEEHGITVTTTDVGDRYVLEALRRDGGVLGGEQSGHIIYLRDHVTGDGLAAALLVCGALEGRTLAEAAAVMPRYPQVKDDIRVARREVTPAIEQEVDAVNANLDGDGRVLVRPSGTEPVIRVLAEAPDEAAARDLCGSIGALVRRELG
jgi:phosphoglucosamine mutase